MLLRLIGCFMVAAVSADVAITGHEFSSDSKNPKIANLAARLVSIDDANYLRKANDDSANADEYLLKAAERNPWRTDTWIRLSVDAEARGDIGDASHYLAEAAAHDAGGAPRWANANFYFRRGDSAQFLKWANSYRERTHENEAGLFRMVSEVAPTPHAMLEAMPRMECDELGSMLDTLSDKAQDPDEVVQRMSSDCHDPASHKALTHLVSGLLEKDNPVKADHVWREMGGAGVLANSDFKEPISGEGFDWRINQNNAIQYKQTDLKGIHFNFNDSVPSGTVLLFQPVALTPKGEYRLVMDFDSDPAETQAFRWELVELSTGRHLASGLDLENINQQPVWRFEVPPTEKTVALALFYARPSGTTPFQGTVQIHGIQLARQIVPEIPLPTKPQRRSGY